ncbi:hypothetical protein ACFLQU_04660 [Verrucomicrobiota bacterium]
MMRYVALLSTVLVLALAAGCSSTPATSSSDPADHITALVVAGRYEDAISAFLELPPSLNKLSYVRAANAASLACATLGALQKDPARQKAFFEEAVRILPDITKGKYHVPDSSDFRAEMDTAQAIVRTTIKHLQARAKKGNP